MYIYVYVHIHIYVYIYIYMYICMCIGQGRDLWGPTEVYIIPSGRILLNGRDPRGAHRGNDIQQNPP